MRNNKSKQVIMGGIIKHSNGGYGFKITFPSSLIANHYKDMIRWIIVDDGHPLVYKTGYYDIYTFDGDRKHDLLRKHEEKK